MTDTRPPDIQDAKPATVGFPMHVPYREAFLVWLKIAALSFGGPTAQIAVMHRILVDEKRWISEQRFLHALNYCMLLPGPEAQQLSVYIGWLLHRVRGGLTAGILFILPGCVSILVLSILYEQYHQTVLLQSTFFGLKAAIIAIVLEAVIRVARRALRNRMMLCLACLAFLAMYCLHIPFPGVIVAAGALGWLGGRLNQSHPIETRATQVRPVAAENLPPADRLVQDPYYRPSAMKFLRVLVICVGLWVAPVVASGWLWGWNSIFVDQGIYFGQLALVTFGGAYAALAYVAQQAVDVKHWLTAGEMLDGLGLAESTPGPLIMVVQFVAYLGAARHPAPLSPVWAGVVGSMLTTWVTFVPCFFFIFAGAPYVEALRHNRHLTAALSGVTAAVVGVMVNLAVWFAIQTLFQQSVEVVAWPLRVLLPVPSTLDPAAAVITLAAVIMTFHYRWSLWKTLLACALAGWVVHLVR